MRKEKRSKMRSRLRDWLAPRNPKPRQQAPQSLAQLLRKATARDIPADRGDYTPETSSEGSE